MRARANLRSMASPGVRTSSELVFRFPPESTDRAPSHTFSHRASSIDSQVHAYDCALKRLEGDNKIETYNAALECAIKVVNVSLDALELATRPGAQGQDTFSTHAPLANMASEMLHGLADDVVKASADGAQLNLLLQTMAGKLTSRATQFARQSAGLAPLSAAERR